MQQALCGLVMSMIIFNFSQPMEDQSTCKHLLDVLGVKAELQTNSQIRTVRACRPDAVCMAAGFESHDRPLKSARLALDEISHEKAPSQWLEERSADKKPAQQLGTLGGGNHFLEVLLLHHHTLL